MFIIFISSEVIFSDGHLRNEWWVGHTPYSPRFYVIQVVLDTR